MDWDEDGHLKLKPAVKAKYKINETTFTDVFAGPEPVFEVTKRVKGLSSKKSQGTLDGWVSSSGKSASTSSLPKAVNEKDKAAKNKVKKQTAAEIEAEMKRIREQN